MLYGTDPDYAMNTIISNSKSICLLGGLFLLGACGHDAKRTNPLDPQLTPPVELQIALDDTAGTVTLTWIQYEGEQPFGEYRVLRKVPGLEVVDTLAVIADISFTSHTDTTLRANTGYAYRVSVINSSGLETTSEDWDVEGCAGNPVNLFDPEVDPDSVTLRWDRFSGGRFEAYRVERFRLDLRDFEEIGRLSNVSDTLFTDHDPVLEVSRYRIVVEAAGETWVSSSSDRVRLSSPVVDLQAVVFDGGSANLTWSPYTGEETFVDNTR